MSRPAHDSPQEQHQEELSFLRRYVFSTDHKTIGRQFLFASLVFAVIGGWMAMVIRTQLAWPGGGFFPFGKIDPAGFYGAVTQHGTIMIFLVVIPTLLGGFGNYTIPLMIGARDMAFPRLNMLSYWILWPAFLAMLASFFVPGGPAQAGWTNYPPLSAQSPAAWGQTLWLVAIIFVGLGSILGAMNYLTTILQYRAPGMSLTRMPLTVWGLFTTSILVLLATPSLTAAAILLVLDRSVGTNWYDVSLGGQPLLWQHLFWFYSHPAVYIMIIPAMGLVSDVISTFARKPIFGYQAMVGAMAGIAFIAFIVWGHHMFVSGMNPVLGSTFMVTTMFVAVPTGVKVFNWLATLWGGNIQYRVPMLHALAFVSMFIIGGLSGIFLASTPVNIHVHDTYFVVAHLHYVLFGGSLFGIFAGITYWFPKMFGRHLNETLGRIHWLGTLVFFNLVFLPMHNLGLAGMPRRLADPYLYDFLKPFQELNQWMTLAAYLLGAFQVVFAVNVLWSLRRGAVAEPNPYLANTLEWQAPSPPPHLNWGPALPVVYRGPYEYASPEIEEDYWPQTAPPGQEPRPVTPEGLPAPAPAGGGAAE